MLDPSAYADERAAERAASVAAAANVRDMMAAVSVWHVARLDPSVTVEWWGAGYEGQRSADVPPSVWERARAMGWDGSIDILARVEDGHGHMHLAWRDVGGATWIAAPRELVRVGGGA